MPTLFIFVSLDAEISVALVNVIRRSLIPCPFDATDANVPIDVNTSIIVPIANVDFLRRTRKPI